MASRLFLAAVAARSGAVEFVADEGVKRGERCRIDALTGESALHEVSRLSLRFLPLSGSI